jgi:hypothetical protein
LLQSFRKPYPLKSTGTGTWLSLEEKSSTFELLRQSFLAPNEFAVEFSPSFPGCEQITRACPMTGLEFAPVVDPRGD